MKFNLYRFVALSIMVASANLMSCKAAESKKDCVADDEEQCAELRINEGSGYVYYTLGDTTLRANAGTFGDTDRVTFSIIGQDAVAGGINLCGGTLVSRIYYWNLKVAPSADSGESTQRERKSLTQRQYLSIRMPEAVTDRDKTLFGIVVRSVPTAKVYYVDSSQYQPTGASAADEKNVDFYTREVDAAYYLVQAPSGIAADCQPLPAQEPSKDPDHAIETATDAP